MSLFRLKVTKSVILGIVVMEMVDKIDQLLPYGFDWVVVSGHVGVCGFASNVCDVFDGKGRVVEWDADAATNTICETGVGWDRAYGVEWDGYPIEGKAGYVDRSLAGTLWEGEAGERRREYARYIGSQLRDDLRERSRSWLRDSLAAYGVESDESVDSDALIDMLNDIVRQELEDLVVQNAVKLLCTKRGVDPVMVMDGIMSGLNGITDPSDVSHVIELINAHVALALDVNKWAARDAISEMVQLLFLMCRSVDFVDRVKHLVGTNRTWYQRGDERWMISLT